MASKASRRSKMVVANKLQAVSKMLTAGHIQMAENFAHPGSLYFKVNPAHMGGIPQMRIAAAVEMRNTSVLEAIAAELLAEAFAE